MPSGSILDRAHQAVRDTVVPGSLALDATVGNGYDTLVLARLVGDEGQVLGLDIQEAALASARRRLAAAGLQHRVCLSRQDHRNADLHLAPRLDRPFLAAMYNLGYLPGSDKSVVTQPESTVASLDGVSKALSPGGVVTIVGYRGHTGGAEESQAVAQWCEQLDPAEFDVLCDELVDRGNTAPYLIIVRKRYSQR